MKNSANRRLDRRGFFFALVGRSPTGEVEPTTTTPPTATTAPKASPSATTPITTTRRDTEGKLPPMPTTTTPSTEPARAASTVPGVVGGTFSLERFYGERARQREITGDDVPPPPRRGSS